MYLSVTSFVPFEGGMKIYKCLKNRKYMIVEVYFLIIYTPNTRKITNFA